MRPRDVARNPWILGGLAVLLLGGLAALALRSAIGGDTLDELEQARRAGEQAQSRSAQIAENLRTIAENLEEGASLEHASAEIEGLTLRQQQSLRDLADLLREQLASTRRTAEALRGTRESSAAVAEIGERQARAVAKTLAALRRLESFAADASEASADFALMAIYGAALAEDTQQAFSGP